MPSAPQTFGHPLDQNFGSDQWGALNDLDTTQGQLFEIRFTDLENTIQSLARDYHTNGIFPNDLEQRLRQTEARLDALSYFCRQMEDWFPPCDMAEECGRRIPVVEERMDMLERRHEGRDDRLRREGTLSRRIPPANSAFVHERGPSTVGRGRFNSGSRKRQRVDSGGQNTGDDGDWLLGSEKDLFDHVQHGSGEGWDDGDRFRTTLPPRTRSLDLQ